MDWRGRQYYLVQFDGYRFHQIIKELKDNIKTLKMHQPYKHHAKDRDKIYYKSYDSDVFTTSEGKYRYWQFMIGCNDWESKKLEYYLDSYCNNYSWTDYMKLDKNMCGQ